MFDKRWIAVYLDVFDKPLFDETSAYSKAAAWLDLVLANDNGMVVTSESKLMNRWGWSKTKLRAFLQALEMERMITRSADKKSTNILLTDYVQSDVETTKKTSGETTPIPMIPEDTVIPKTTQKTSKEPTELTNLKDFSIPIVAIVAHLNLQTNQNYRASGKLTQQKIRARMNEGFTLDDFLQVIDYKAGEWMGTTYANYLRPETLFGNKFESYLNQAKLIVPAGPKSWDALRRVAAELEEDGALDE